MRTNTAYAQPIAATRTTFGDDQEIQCPACGDDIDLTELACDLEAGMELECEHCEAAVVLTEVTFMCDTKAQAKTPNNDTAEA